MKTIVILIFATIILFQAHSQITSGNWMLGGNASFSSLNSSSSAAAQFKQVNIQISPEVGYFLKNKFSVGLKPSYTYGNNKVGNTNTIIGIGPFTRYYFLNSERVFNLFVEGAYSWSRIYGTGYISSTSSTFSISAGPVIYFNSSVGLEFDFAYSTTKVVAFSGANNEIRFGIGFQFYLERGD